MRANVLLPTATLPATPITYGTFFDRVPRNPAEALCRFCDAATYMFSRRVSGR